MPPPTGVVSGPLMAMRNSLMASSVPCGSHSPNLPEGFFARKDFVPNNAPLAAKNFLHRRVKNSLARLSKCRARFRRLQCRE